MLADKRTESSRIDNIQNTSHEIGEDFRGFERFQAVTLNKPTWILPRFFPLHLLIAQPELGTPLPMSLGHTTNHPTCLYNRGTCSLINRIQLNIYMLIDQFMSYN